MKKFLIGFVLGIFVTCVFYFAPLVDPRARIYLGQLLDMDTVQLKNGSVMYGRIIKEENDKIWIEVKNGYFTLSRSEYADVQKNFFMRYIRELL